LQIFLQSTQKNVDFMYLNSSLIVKAQEKEHENFIASERLEGE